MFGDAAGIGEDAVDRHERGNRGEDRQEAVVGHAGGERENAVLADVAVDAPGDVLPAPRGDFRRRCCVTSAVSAFGGELGRRGMPIGIFFRGKGFVVFGLCRPFGRHDAIPQKRHGQQSQRCCEIPSLAAAIRFRPALMQSSGRRNSWKEGGVPEDKLLRRGTPRPAYPALCSPGRPRTASRRRHWPVRSPNRSGLRHGRPRARGPA